MLPASIFTQKNERKNHLWDDNETTFRISTLTSSCRRLSSLAIVDDKRYIFFQLCRDPASASSAYVHTE